MGNSIQSGVIGTMLQDNQLPEWWISEPVAIPLLSEQKIPITFMDLVPAADESFVREADKALANFLSLTVNDRNDLSDLVYKNCTDFLEMVGDDELDDQLRSINDSIQIWNFVYPTEIYVSRRARRDKDIYISISCNCEWEQEHGLQLVFRQGRKLTRISSNDGHLTESDAYDTPDEEDELLSKF